MILRPDMEILFHFGISEWIISISLYEVMRLCGKIKERCKERADTSQKTADSYVRGLRFCSSLRDEISSVWITQMKKWKEHPKKRFLLRFFLFAKVAFFDAAKIWTIQNKLVVQINQSLYLLFNTLKNRWFYSSFFYLFF